MKPTILEVLVTLAVPLVLGCEPAGDMSTPAEPLGSEPATVESDPDQTAEPVTTDAYMVRVIVHDDTENRPLHPKAEIWFRGRGSWWIKKSTAFGSATEDLAKREPNVNDTIHIYPDGRDGKEIVASLTMTPRMNPKGSTRDAVTIVIADNEVVVYGLPVKAATGEFEHRFKR